MTALRAALESMGVQNARVVVEHPAELSHGDYATGAALQYGKHLGKAPRALAEELAEILRSSTLLGPTSISKIEVAGPGFINFHLSATALAQSVRDAIAEERWGAGTELEGKKVMVEYTDPNPFKEFHIGHLMSNAIGESISRLFEYSGASVVRANWQGDVGPHVAKAIWGKMHNPELSWGSAYVFGSEAYETHKEEVDAINEKVYAKSDARVNKLYDEGRAQSLAHFEEIYEVLGTKFDHYFFESKEGMEGVGIVKANMREGVFEESQGAVVFKGEQYGLHTRVFLTSKGLPTYEAKELGLNKAKFEHEPDADTSVIVTANEQNDYFRVVLKAMELVLPEVAQKTLHISHGMMRFAEGKMSSRKGNVVTGESLLTELTSAAQERAKESRAEDHGLLAQQVAVAAIKYQVLKQASGKDIIFDREHALSLEGDSGPYLQYTHARTCAVVEKASSAGVYPGGEASRIPDSAYDLARLLHRFPEVVARAMSEIEPHHVTTYLLQLSALFNRWYANEQILDGTQAQAHKVALTAAVARTLRNGLHILGIPAPEKM